MGTVGFGGFNQFAFNVEEFNAVPEVTISWIQQQSFQPQVRQELPSHQLAAMASGSSALFVPTPEGWQVQQPRPLPEPVINPARYRQATVFPLFILPVEPPFELVKVVGSDDTAILLQGEVAAIDGLVGISNIKRPITGSVFPTIETVGSQAVQYLLEGSIGLIKKAITGQSNRKVILVGEHQPKRQV